MKRSRLISIAVALLLPLAAIADSYTSLWKQYDVAVRKDHPQTVLRLLSQIADKAQRERAYGQLLKAQVKSADYQCELSVDSLQPVVERMKLMEQQAVNSGDNVLAAIYQSVLGSVYTNNSFALDDAKATGKQYFKKDRTSVV